MLIPQLADWVPSNCFLRSHLTTYNWFFFTRTGATLLSVTAESKKHAVACVFSFQFHRRQFHFATAIFLARSKYSKLTLKKISEFSSPPLTCWPDVVRIQRYFCFEKAHNWTIKIRNIQNNTIRTRQDDEHFDVVGKISKFRFVNLKHIFSLHQNWVIPWITLANVVKLSGKRRKRKWVNLWYLYYALLEICNLNNTFPTANV